MLLARILVALVSIETLVGSNLADWNHTHISVRCGRRTLVFMEHGSYLR
jgi:hypothetical protein